MTAKFAWILLFVSLAPFLHAAETSSLPEPMLARLKAGAPGAKIKAWKNAELPNKAPGYEIELTDDLNSDTYKVVLDAQGEWFRSQKHYVANTSLPAPIALLFDRVGPAPNNDVHWSFERDSKGDRFEYKWKTDIRDSIPLGGVRAIYELRSSGPGLWTGKVDRLQYPLGLKAELELTQKQDGEIWLRFTKVEHLHSLINDWAKYEGDGAALK